MVNFGDSVNFVVFIDLLVYWFIDLLIFSLIKDEESSDEESGPQDKSKEKKSKEDKSDKDQVKNSSHNNTEVKQHYATLLIWIGDRKFKIFV